MITKSIWFATLTAICGEATTNYAVFRNPQHLKKSILSLQNELKSESDEMASVSVNKIARIKINEIFYFSDPHPTMIGLLLANKKKSNTYLFFINHAPIVHHDYLTGRTTQDEFDHGSWFEMSLNDIVCDEESKSITEYSRKWWNSELVPKIKEYPYLFIMLDEFIRRAKSLFDCLQTFQGKETKRLNKK